MHEDGTASECSVESYGSNSNDNKKEKSGSNAVMEMDLFNVPRNKNKRPTTDYNIENQFGISDNLVFFTSSSYTGTRTGKIRKYWLKDEKHQESAYEENG